MDKISFQLTADSWGIMLFKYPKLILVVLPILTVMGVIFFYEPTRAAVDTCAPEAGYKYTSSWAWTETTGWISLSCQSEKDAEEAGHGTWGGINYGVEVMKLANLNNNHRAIIGWAWSANVGWICFGKKCTETYPQLITPIYDSEFNNESWAKVSEDGLISGWANIVSLGDEGWISLRGLVATGDPYGARVGLNGAWEGWAWNGNSDKTGIGWIQFSPPYGSPWIKTEHGDIYSGNKIEGGFDAPLGLYNATYCILANGQITNFVTEDKNNTTVGTPCWKTDAGVIAFPASENSFTTSTGNIDWKGLYAGQYGQVKAYEKVGGFVLDDILNSQPLNGKVIRVRGDAKVSQLTTLVVGSSGLRANGTVIVEGDLTIGANIVYGNRQFAKLQELPTIGFLVRGDIIIDSAVSELVGAYVALGKNDPNCAKTINDGCGQFKTGSSSTHLTVGGLIMGRKLSFGRTASGTSGSEEIIADGRLMANPPPGFTDLLKGLPVWQQVAP